jgi:hypothetical protein
MNTPTTTADQQGRIEAIPESMPQLQRLEESFADFLVQHKVFIDDYFAKKEAGQEPDRQQLLTALSNEQVTVTYRYHENTEGSFYFKDNETGDEIRFRTAGTGGNHTYMKDANGTEQLFLNGLNPAKGQKIRQTLKRLQGGKNVSLIGDNGIGVTYQTKEDYNRQSEARDRHDKISNQVQQARSNILKALWNRKNIKELEASLAESPNPYDGNRDEFITRVTIPASESEAIFERFNKIIAATTASLRQH